MSVVDQRCPVCGLTYEALRGPLSFQEAYDCQRKLGGRSTRMGALRILGRAKREAWDHHLDTCDTWPVDRVSFATPSLEAPRMPQDAREGREARTAYLSVPDALAGSVVPGIDASDDWGASDWTPDPERLAFERDWTAREAEAVRILGADLARVLAA